MAVLSTHRVHTGDIQREEDGDVFLGWEQKPGSQRSDENFGIHSERAQLLNQLHGSVGRILHVFKDQIKALGTPAHHVSGA